MVSKICSKCGIDRPLSEYFRQTKGLFGRQASCKSCYRLYDKRLDYKLEWLRKNKEKSNAASKRWRQKNPEKFRDSKKDWNKRNPDRVAIHKKTYKHKRRQRMATNGRNDLTTAQIRKLFAQYTSCIYCGSSTKLTLEHLKPISCGGENTIENCAVACSACNSDKGSVGPIEYIKKLMGWR